MATRLDIALAINKAASYYEEWAATAAYAGKIESAELTAEQARLMRTGADYVMAGGADNDRMAVADNAVPLSLVQFEDE